MLNTNEILQSFNPFQLAILSIWLAAIGLAAPQLASFTLVREDLDDWSGDFFYRCMPINLDRENYKVGVVRHKYI